MTSIENRLARMRKRLHDPVLGIDWGDVGKNAFGGLHTAGKLVASAFGMRGAADQLEAVENQAGLLPSWAVTAQQQPATSSATGVTAPSIVAGSDYVVIVRGGQQQAVVQAPSRVVVTAGQRFDGNGYAGEGLGKRFSFGYDHPTLVEVFDRTGVRTVYASADMVLFLGGVVTAATSARGDIMGRDQIGFDADNERVLQALAIDDIDLAEVNSVERAMAREERGRDRADKETLAAMNTEIDAVLGFGIDSDTGEPRTEYVDDYVLGCGVICGASTKNDPKNTKGKGKDKGRGKNRGGKVSNVIKGGQLSGDQMKLKPHAAALTLSVLAGKSAEKIAAHITQRVRAYQSKAHKPVTQTNVKLHGDLGHFDALGSLLDFNAIGDLDHFDAIGSLDDFNVFLGASRAVPPAVIKRQISAIQANKIAVEKMKQAGAAAKKSAEATKEAVRKAGPVIKKLFEQRHPPLPRRPTGPSIHGLGSLLDFEANSFNAIGDLDHFEALGDLDHFNAIGDLDHFDAIGSLDDFNVFLGADANGNNPGDPGYDATTDPSSPSYQGPAGGAGDGTGAYPNANPNDPYDGIPVPDPNNFGKLTDGTDDPDWVPPPLRGQPLDPAAAMVSWDHVPDGAIPYNGEMGFPDQSVGSFNPFYAGNPPSGWTPVPYEQGGKYAGFEMHGDGWWYSWVNGDAMHTGGEDRGSGMYDYKRPNDAELASAVTLNKSSLDHNWGPLIGNPNGILKGLQFASTGSGGQWFFQPDQTPATLPAAVDADKKILDLNKQKAQTTRDTLRAQVATDRQTAKQLAEDAAKKAADLAAQQAAFDQQQAQTQQTQQNQQAQIDMQQAADQAKFDLEQQRQQMQMDSAAQQEQFKQNEFYRQHPELAAPASTDDGGTTDDGGAQPDPDNPGYLTDGSPDPAWDDGTGTAAASTTDVADVEGPAGAPPGGDPAYDALVDLPYPNA